MMFHFFHKRDYTDSPPLLELRGRTIEGLIKTRVWLDYLVPIFAEAGLLKVIKETVLKRKAKKNDLSG